MNKQSFKCVTVMVLAVAGAMGGCKSAPQHTQQAAAGTVIGCQSCFDEIHRVRNASGSRAGILHGRTQVKHQCPSCKTEMAFYAENGALMVKCSHCARMGAECDKCMAPAHGEHHTSK